MKKTKLEKGITLIALIITIVVLLILAVVTIGAVQESRIIAHAQNAATEYKKAQEEEQITLGYSEYKIDSITNPNANLKVQGATVEGDKVNGWTVKFELGKTYKVSPDGNVENYEPVVNPNPTGWDIAYIHNGTKWESTPIYKTTEGAAEKVATSKIVAKFYEVELDTAEAPKAELSISEEMIFSFPALNKRYKLFVEGTGDMGTMVRN